MKLRFGLAAALAAPCLACSSGPPDPMIDRCSVVVEYKHPELRSLDIALVRISGNAVTLDFDGVDRETKEKVADRILCEFDASQRMKLSRIAIGGESLTEAEVALANSELLLRDLGRDPADS